MLKCKLSWNRQTVKTLTTFDMYPTALEGGMIQFTFDSMPIPPVWINAYILCELKGKAIANVK